MEEERHGMVETMTGVQRLVARFRRELLRALVADSVQRVVGWTMAAVIPLVYAAFRLVYHERSSTVLGAIGVAAVLLVPPIVGATRSRTLDRALKAETENKRLREVNEGLLAEQGQANRSGKVLADWLTNTLVEPYRRRGLDPNRDFETWLNDIVIKVMRVLFPAQGTVGIAIIVERFGTYSITHRSAGLPEQVLKVDPAPVHRPLKECIQRHAPHARVLSFSLGEEQAWVAFFPERPFEEGMQESSSIAAIAATVAGVYTNAGIAFPTAT
jgi:hypothetical protein